MLARKLNFYRCRDKAIPCTLPHDPFKKMDEPRRGKKSTLCAHAARKYFRNNRDSPRVLRVFRAEDTTPFNSNTPIHLVLPYPPPSPTFVSIHPIRIIRPPLFDHPPFLLPSFPSCKHTGARNISPLAEPETHGCSRASALYRQAIRHVTTTCVLHERKSQCK